MSVTQRPQYRVELVGVKQIAATLGTLQERVTLFSELAIVTEGGIVEAIALTPMAVIPSRRRRGIGSTPVGEGLRVCSEAGHRMVVVLGHPEFYARFGSSAKPAERLESPHSGPAFMAIGLVPGALKGITGEVRHPPPFEAF